MRSPRCSSRIWLTWRERSAWTTRPDSQHLSRKLGATHAPANCTTRGQSGCRGYRRSCSARRSSPGSVPPHLRSRKSPAASRRGRLARWPLSGPGKSRAASRRRHRRACRSGSRWCPRSRRDSGRRRSAGMLVCRRRRLGRQAARHRMFEGECSCRMSTSRRSRRRSPEVGAGQPVQTRVVQGLIGCSIARASLAGDGPLHCGDLGDACSAAPVMGRRA